MNSEKIYLYQALVKVKFTFATPLAKVKVNLLPSPPLPVKVAKAKVQREAKVDHDVISTDLISPSFT